MTSLTAADHPGSDAPTERRHARFGTFELDVKTSELRRGGIRVPLQEQPFKILLMLLERPGEVVTREELRERLWPGEYVDFDQGLNTAIRKLRTALDDSADNPRFVKTLARKGYRFIAPVTWLGNVTAAETVARTVPSSPPRRRRVSAPLAAVISGVVVAAIAISLANIRRPAATTPRVETIAVLPFANEDPRTEHISDGLTEELIDELSRVPNLRVMARTSVFRYKGRNVEPREVRDDLDVDAVVTGRLRPSGAAYNLRVELIDASDGSQIYGEGFNATADILPQLRRRIAGSLAESIRYGRGRAPSRSADPEAYDLYLRGLQAWNNRSTPELKRAIELFTRATQIDPYFAQAYSGLANTWGVMVGYGLISPEEATPRILAAAEKTLELDPTSAEAYTSIATTKFRNLWDFKGAEEDYRKALALNPNYATGHSWFANLLQSTGRFEEARQHTETAYRLDPLADAIAASLCHLYINERRIAEGAAFYRRAIELDPPASFPFCMGRALLLLSDYDGFIKLHEQKPAANSKRLIEAYRSGGREALLRARLDGLLSRPDPENVPVEVALAYATLGDKENAFHWLEIGYRNRVSRLTSFHLDPEFDFMRDDPRFDDLVRRVGLPKFDPPVSQKMKDER